MRSASANTTSSVVLDDHNGKRARQGFDQLHHLSRLGRRHAGGRFVKHQQFRFGRKRQCYLQHTLLTVRKMARALLANIGQSVVREQGSAFRIERSVLLRGQHQSPC